MLAYLLEHKNPRGRIETNSKSFDNIWSGNTEKKIGQRTAFFFIFIGWSFTNYFDKNLGFFWPPPPLNWHFLWHRHWLRKGGDFWTNYLHRRLVNVICERPLLWVFLSFRFIFSPSCLSYAWIKNGVIANSN